MSSQRRTALITGSNKNIGRSCALFLAKAGCNVVVNGSQDKTAAEKVAAEVREMLVREGEPVRRGQVIARLDASEPQARLDEKIADLEAGRAQLALADCRAELDEFGPHVDTLARATDLCLTLGEPGLALQFAEQLATLAPARGKGRIGRARLVLADSRDDRRARARRGAGPRTRRSHVPVRVEPPEYLRHSDPVLVTAVSTPHHRQGIAGAFSVSRMAPAADGPHAG